VGADPYEGLNTVAGRMARSRRARQFVIQAYKRLPFAPPGPFRAAPTANAKALGLALSGYATPAGLDLEGAGKAMASLEQRISELNLRPGEAAWGYHFDAQTRHLFYDRRTPNAIATCFVVGGLLDAHEATGEASSGELALAARPFLLALAGERSEGTYFSYVESGSELIHNANLMVCGVLARLDALDSDRQVAELVSAAVDTTIEAQGKDGLWSYGAAENLRWADNFHTAYLLEGLLRVRKRWGIGADALRRGTAAWRNRFFEPDGWARFYPDRRYPLETHSAASAIDLLCLLAGHAESGADDPLAFADAVAKVAVRELWLEAEGRFAFRRSRQGLNRREFMRWTNAPMFKALATLCSRLGEAEEPVSTTSSERVA
jgi:hypothetical protein